MKNLIEFNSASMTSLEIADLVQSRHDSVKRTIETLVKKRIIELPQTVEIKTATKPTATYVFRGEQGKRDSIIVVAQLCPEFTARLVDRWYELENQQPVFDISNPHHLLQAIEIQSKQNIELTHKIELLEPKAQALDTIANTEGTYNIRECAKTIGIAERKLIKLLIDKKWIYREENGRLQPYSTKRESGVFINRPSPVITNKNTGEEKVHLHMRITALGLTKITELVLATLNHKVAA